MRCVPVLPPGLFLDKVLDYAKVELRAECDYRQEALHQARFQSLLRNDPDVAVPSVVPELCTGRVLTSHMAHGAHQIPQATPIRMPVSTSQRGFQRVCSCVRNAGSLVVYWFAKDSCVFSFILNSDSKRRQPCCACMSM